MHNLQGHRRGLSNLLMTSGAFMEDRAFTLSFTTHWWHLEKGAGKVRKNSTQLSRCRLALLHAQVMGTTLTSSNILEAMTKWWLKDETATVTRGCMVTVRSICSK